jgi:hypothetical protein
VVFAGAVLSMVLTVGSATASPLFEVAGSVGDQGGLQGRTLGTGASAAYYNPALLTEAKSGLSVGFFVLGTDINVSYGARPAAQRYNVPNFGAGPSGFVPTGPGGVALPNFPIPTAVLQNGQAASGPNAAIPARPRGAAGTGHQSFTYEMIGLVAKLFHDRFAIGVYGLIPNGQFTNASAFYSDEREQYFSNSLHPELYGDRLTAVSFAFAAAYKFSDAFSVGVGATLSLNNTGVSPVYVANGSDLQNLLVDSNIKVNAGLAPHFGVSFKPIPRWRLTATAHAPEELKIVDAFGFSVMSGAPQTSTITFVHDFMPWELGAGTSYDVLQDDRDTVTVALTGLYTLWSTYEDRHGDKPIAPYGWYDTLAPTAGVRLQHDDLGTFLDVNYTPTPVPAQTGRTNYVDNDKVGGDVGVDYSFKVLGVTMKVGAQFEAQRLIPRTQVKIPTPNEPDGQNHYPALVQDEVPDNAQMPGSLGSPVPIGQQAAGLQTNNPGWPGFGSEGWVLGGGVTLSVIP